MTAWRRRKGQERLGNAAKGSKPLMFGSNQAQAIDDGGDENGATEEDEGDDGVRPIMQAIQDLARLIESKRFCPLSPRI